MYHDEDFQYTAYCMCHFLMEDFLVFVEFENLRDWFLPLVVSMKWNDLPSMNIILRLRISFQQTCLA